MSICHVVTIRVAPGRADEFAGAFKAVQAIAQQEEGCEQYELFQSLDDPEKDVLLETPRTPRSRGRTAAAERDRARGRRWDCFAGEPDM